MSDRYYDDVYNYKDVSDFPEKTRLFLIVHKSRKHQIADGARKSETKVKMYFIIKNGAIFFDLFM